MNSEADISYSTFHTANGLTSDEIRQIQRDNEREVLMSRISRVPARRRRMAQLALDRELMIIADRNQLT